ncbi:P-loop containing nucleoside triphosphate hydrolase protein [Baffinella frigidus]|nr:P-loop containing nucleoside triphosphate hydrolase protein [Cryptophyta sp. CCMP2293]
MSLFFDISNFLGEVTFGPSTLNPKLSAGGDVLLTFFAILIGCFMVGQIPPNILAIRQGSSAAERLTELINRTPSIDVASPGGLTPPDVGGDLEFRGVTFSYPSRPDAPVLNGLSLSVRRGGTVALVGASGSGKSTVVALVERFYDPSGEAVLLDGRDVREVDLKWLRRQVGLVSQEPVLFSVSVGENIRYGREDASEEEVEEAARQANALQFVQGLPEGFATLCGERGAQMSGGQKQRIAIARALVRDPRILLLDEATSALDSESERLVQAALEGVMGGRTVLLVAHRLSTVRSAERIAVLEGGGVAEEGRHEELLAARGAYWALVLQHAPGVSVSLPGREVPLTLIVDASGVAPPSPQPDVRDSSGPSQEEEEVPHKEEEEKWARVGTWCRALRRNRPESGWAVGGVLGAAMLGAVRSVRSMLQPARRCLRFRLPILEGEGGRGGEIGLYGRCATWIVSNRVSRQMWCFGVMGERLTFRLRLDSFRAILRQDTAFFDTGEQSSALTAALARDAALVQIVSLATLDGVGIYFVLLHIALAVAFAHGWELTLLTISCLPALVLGIYLRTRSMLGAAGKGPPDGGAAGLAGEAIGARRLVASLGAEGRVVAAYRRRLDAEGRRARVKRAVGHGAGDGLSLFATFFIYFVGFAFGAYLMKNGGYTFDDVLKVFLMIAFMGRGMGYATALAPDMGTARSALRRTFELIDLEPSIDVERGGGATPPDVSGDLEFRGVTFSYPSRPDARVLNGLSLSVRRGGTVALVGASGSGKSTVVALVERFYDPSEGTVLLDGRDVREVDLKWLRRQVGLVSQEPVLFSVSVGENIRYGREDASEEEVEEAARQANALQFVQGLPEGFATLCGERGAQMSGGQKQRIAIARALVRDPRILLLDEATSALDSESERLVQAALEGVMGGRTVLLVAHRLSTVRSAERIAVLEGGRVAEEGRHEELLAARGAYWALVRQQMGPAGSDEEPSGHSSVAGG